MDPSTRKLSRRGVLEALGVGVLGLTGAALLGCSGSTRGGGDGQPAGAPVPQSAGVGLPMTAPVVQGKPRQGGTFTQFLLATNRQLDPHTNLGLHIWHVIGEKALEPDPVTGEIRPHLLTSWEVADPNGLTLVFKLHPSLFIHNKPPWNGRQFTAEDVAWNMERIGGLYAERLKIPLSAFQRASMVANIVKAEAVDKLTVKVTLSKPNSSYFKGLMDTRVMMTPREMDDIGWKDPMKFGGVGAFQVSEYVEDQKMNYTKFDRYFRPTEPHFDAANWTVIPDNASALAAFISGQLQMIPTVQQEEIATIKKARPDALHYSWIDVNWDHLRPGMAYEPFRDFRVRKSMSLAIDYAAIADGFFGAGWGYQASIGPFFPEGWKPDKVKTLPGFNPDTKTADRAEASKLMAAAGYPNGKGIDFQVGLPTGAANKEHGTRFQAQMPTVFPDMKVTLRQYSDSASFTTDALVSGKSAMTSYVITAAPDAVIDMASQYRTGGSRNYGQFSDPNLDALIDKAQSELKSDVRTKLLDEFQQRFMTEWMPNFVVCAKPARNAVQANIGGFDTTAGSWFASYAAHTKVCRWFYVDK